MLLWLLVLAGCVSVNHSPEQQSPEQTDGASFPNEFALPGADSDQSINPAAALRGLRVAQRQDDWSLAERILDICDWNHVFSELNANHLAEFTLLAAESWQHTNRIRDSIRWLEHPQLMAQIPFMRLQDQVAISLARADTQHELGLYSASARERISIEPLLDNTQQREDNAGAIWQSVKHISADSAAQQLQQFSSKAYRAWLELAMIYHASNIDIGNQATQVNDWKQRWPGHPATKYLPDSVRQLQRLAANRPEKIAVFLPLSGKLEAAGKAVLDGFTASYFRARQSGWVVPQLVTYDTQSDSLETLYKNAHEDGCDFLIGPLEKNKVAELLTMPIAMPGIALNYVTNGMPALGNVVQFGLAAEDEARQLANHARINGYRRALVLQATSDWALRAGNAFAAEWNNAESTVAAYSQLRDAEDFSADIAASLLLPASEQRHQRLQQLTRNKLEFTPRRRNDFDFVALFANNEQAVSIKPLLAYHYAKNVPVIASSHVYHGTPGQREHDLNGITFNEIPWIMEQPPLFTQSNENYQQNKFLGRLFAMGADAFLIHSRIGLLAGDDSPAIRGLTGTLSVNGERIERKLVMTKMERGLPAAE